MSMDPRELAAIGKAQEVTAPFKVIGGSASAVMGSLVQELQANRDLVLGGPGTLPPTEVDVALAEAEVDAQVREAARAERRREAFEALVEFGFDREAAATITGPGTAVFHEVMELVMVAMRESEADHKRRVKKKKPTAVQDVWAALGALEPDVMQAAFYGAVMVLGQLRCDQEDMQAWVQSAFDQGAVVVEDVPGA